MRWLIDLAYLGAGLVYLPVVLYQAIFQGKNRRGWRERFGGVPALPPDRPRIWIHAVSLGETNATPKLVAAMERLLPGVELVFSATTDTGFSRAVQLYGAERVFRFPLDFSGMTRRALRRIAPSMIVLVELEVWPNLVSLAARKGIPVAVVNGRLTERSARRLARVGRLARPMFEKLSWVGAQDEAIASRFRQLGAPADRVEVTSSLKWDTAEVADRVAGSDALAAAVGIAAGDKVWVCGSTGNDEEAIVLDAYRRLVTEKGLSCRLVIVPRKPERFDEVAKLVEQAGFECVRRSMRPDSIVPRSGTFSAAAEGPPSRAVILGDTMGELRKFYSIASVIFIGRSLVPMGGSDPIEAAALGKPLVVGPDMTNFAAPLEAFRAAKVILKAHSAETLASAINDVLSDPDLARAVGKRARDVVRAHQGATERTAVRLAGILRRHSSGSETSPTDRVVSKSSLDIAAN